MAPNYLERSLSQEPTFVKAHSSANQLFCALFLDLANLLRLFMYVVDSTINTLYFVDAFRQLSASISNSNYVPGDLSDTLAVKLTLSSDKFKNERAKDHWMADFSKYLEDRPSLAGDGWVFRQVSGDKAGYVIFFSAATLYDLAKS